VIYNCALVSCNKYIVWLVKYVSKCDGFTLMLEVAGASTRIHGVTSQKPVRIGLMHKSLSLTSPPRFPLTRRGQAENLLTNSQR
jgi:hypothetical protein